MQDVSEVFALLPAMYQSIQIFVPARGMPPTAGMQTPHSSDSNLATLRTTPDCYSCCTSVMIACISGKPSLQNVIDTLMGLTVLWLESVNSEQLVLRAFADNMAY